MVTRFIPEGIKSQAFPQDSLYSSLPSTGFPLIPAHFHLFKTRIAASAFLTILTLVVSLGDFPSVS